MTDSLPIMVNRGYFEIAKRRIMGANPPLLDVQTTTQERRA